MFRWLIFVILAAALGVSARFRLRARREGGTIPRSSEGAGLIALRLLVALPLFGSIVAYLVHPAWLAWGSYESVPWLRWTGIVLAAGAVPLLFWVLRSIGKNVSETVLTKSGHDLVTSGPYRWVRHPLYTAGTLLLSGIGLAAASWWILAQVALALLLLAAVVVPREEAALIDAFGDRYRDYTSRTPRFVPAPRLRGQA